MAKKKAPGGNKSAAKAAKKLKAVKKVERKEQKNVKKSKGKFDEDDQDLEEILEKMRREWEDAHTVTEELVEGPPSRRANATLTACPNGNHLWCIGGEFFSDEGKAHFYNDVFRYSPEKNEWRKFVSPTCPGPRSAHSVVASPAGGGKIFLFGGEFSSLHQNTFHHYRDFWVFDITTHSWDRIETKVRPSARSGHRMAGFKHYIVLFGGFYDPGATTRYLNDLWIFDTQEYRWREIEFRETDPRPSPRSGFSFLPSPDGIILHGGYCKEYAKGKRPVGVMLEDTWFLHMSITPPPTSTSTSTSTPKTKSSAEPLYVKWERRKRPSYAPSIRSGCTMTLWPSKNTGILFGGVTDEDRHEETLESVFWNDLYGYQIPGKGRWVSMTLKKPKKGNPGGKRKAAATSNTSGTKLRSEGDGESDGDVEDDHDGKEPPRSGPVPGKGQKQSGNPRSTVHQDPDVDPNDPNLTIPLPRYNTMLAVLRNTLYIYGGIYEKGSREYTLDDFHFLALDKMDRYVCLKESEVVIGDEDESSSSDDDDDDDDDDEDEDESEGTNDSDDESLACEDNEVADDVKKLELDDIYEVDDTHKEAQISDDSDLRSNAVAFAQSSQDPKPNTQDGSVEDGTTPLPGETLAMFYARSREHWAQRAHGTSDNRGKQLRKDGFNMAKERYISYKPILEEVEKILQEAGLDEEEMRRSAVVPGVSPGGAVLSRNRR